MKNSKKSGRNPKDTGQDKHAQPQSPMQDQDFIRIQNLVQLAKKNDISELSFERQDYKLTIKRALTTTPTPLAAPLAHPPAIPAAPPTSPPPTPPVPDLEPSATPAPTPSNLHTIKCPIPGTFYRRPAPDKACFVEVGAKVKPGDVLCIVEAMKLFNNIECDVEGKVEEILVEDGTPVEFDQPLFTLSKL